MSLAWQTRVPSFGLTRHFWSSCTLTVTITFTSYLESCWLSHTDHDLSSCRTAHYLHQELPFFDAAASYKVTFRNFLDAPTPMPTLIINGDDLASIYRRQHHDDNTLTKSSIDDNDAEEPPSPGQDDGDDHHSMRSSHQVISAKTALLALKR